MPLYQKIKSKLFGGKNLSTKESKSIFLDLFRDRLPPAEARSLLLLLAQKGETAEEILGCLEAIRCLEPPRKTPFKNLMDTCGTGGDGQQSFNISTLAAVVIAGAGGRVAKHGNRAISSRCGSSDLMEGLGVRLEASPKRMLEAIERCGIGYFHAPFYHLVFRKVQPLRKKLGIKTIFNLMGPLLNPVRIQAQLTGVAQPRLLSIYAEVLKKTNFKNALVCHSRDGMDELSTRSLSDGILLRHGKLQKLKISPRSLKLRRTAFSSMKGGTVRENCRMAWKILKECERNPIRDLIVLNAGAGLWVSGQAKDLAEGIERAEISIDSRTAYQALNGLIEVSNK